MTAHTPDKTERPKTLGREVHEKYPAAVVGENRLRLTADGQLRPCLFSDAEYPVRDALRAGNDRAVAALYRDAIAHKPKQHEQIDGTQRFMSQIGG